MNNVSLIVHAISLRRFRRRRYKRDTPISLALEGNHNKVDEKIIEKPYHTFLSVKCQTRCISYCDLLECVTCFYDWEIAAIQECERRREEDAERKWGDLPSQRQWVINGIVLWISLRACEFAFPRQRRDPKQSRACPCECACMKGRAMPRKLASRASPLSSARTHFHPAVMRILVFLLEHNALEIAWRMDNRLSAS